MALVIFELHIPVNLLKLAEIQVGNDNTSKKSNNKTLQIYSRVAFDQVPKVGVLDTTFFLNFTTKNTTNTKVNARISIHTPRKVIKNSEALITHLKFVYIVNKQPRATNDLTVTQKSNVLWALNKYKT